MGKWIDKKQSTATDEQPRNVFGLHKLPGNSTSVAAFTFTSSEVQIVKD